MIFTPVALGLSPPHAGEICSSECREHVHLHRFTALQAVYSSSSLQLPDGHVHADEDKAKIGLTRQRRGMLSRVAGALALSSPSPKQAADESLVDQWLEFLIQQADAADAAAENAALAQQPAGSPQPSVRSASASQPDHVLQTSRPLHDWNSMTQNAT